MSDLTEAIAPFLPAGTFPDVVTDAIAAYLTDRDAMLRVVDGELELVRAEHCCDALMGCRCSALWGKERKRIRVLTPLEDR
jgi:hypothetical protein